MQLCASKSVPSWAFLLATTAPWRLQRPSAIPPTPTTTTSRPTQSATSAASTSTAFGDAPTEMWTQFDLRCAVLSSVCMSMCARGRQYTIFFVGILCVLCLCARLCEQQCIPVGLSGPSVANIMQYAQRWVKIAPVYAVRARPATAAPPAEMGALLCRRGWARTDDNAGNVLHAQGGGCRWPWRAGLH